MSSIPGPGNPIASSLSQQAVQQGQVARGLDQKRNEAARAALKRDEEIRRHTESVEDSFEASDEHLVVEADRRSRDGEEGRQGQESPPHSKPEKQENPEDDPPAAPRLDLKA